MSGIDPDLREKIDLIFGDLIKWLTERMVSRLPAGLSQSDISSFSDELLQTAKLLNDEFAEEIETHSREKYVDPVLDAVKLLPKDQLAVMAETLVALTSFKKRMSRDSETVGGAIDVAVISKGDGFVWIKRKHYFDPALSPRHGARPGQVSKTIVIMNVILQSLNVDENKPDEIKSTRRIPEKDIFQDEGKTEATKMADRIWERVLTRLEEDKKSS